MINPRDIKIIDNDQEYEVLNIELPDFDMEEYNIYDETEFKYYLDAIEKSVRNSFEYRQFIKFLRNNINMNQCSFFENVNNIDTFKIKIEIHHSPFSLYDIVYMVFKKRQEANECLEVEAVAKEVMYIHYNLIIGLIPLCETVHQLVHNFYIFVPMDKVLGMVDEFIARYGKYMSQEQSDTLNTIREYSMVFNEEENMNPLKRKYIYIQDAGSYNLPTYEDIIAIMRKRIVELKNNNGATMTKVVTLDPNFKQH